MSEQHCEDCDNFYKFDKGEEGLCVWPIPFWVDNKYQNRVESSDGTDCEAWEKRTLKKEP